MWISTDAENFRPENFEICNFYGEDTCFAWQKNLLVVFPYVQTISTPKLPLVVAPREIKSIRNFGGRVFVICKPAGVYKLLKLNKFSALSQTGLGIGPAYYHVHAPENQWLYLKDKCSKNNKQLFPLESSSNNFHEIRDLTLSSTNSEYSLRKALHLLEDGCDEDICIIAYGKKVFKITQHDVRLVYRGEQEIVNIVGILDEETIVGFILVSAKSAVLVYVVEEKLVFDKIYLETEVRGICAGMNGKSSDIIWIAHVDGSHIYYSAKTISTDNFCRTGMESKRCLTIRNYKSKVLIGLTDGKQLIECHIQTLGLGKNDSEEFYNLRTDMFEGSDCLVDEICEKAKVLQKLNENLLEEREKLKRINIYAHRQAIVLLPDVRVQRIADRMFLRIKFEGGLLPFNCYVLAVLSSDRRRTYSIKLVEDSETVVDLPVEKDALDSSLRLSIDLVTLADESKAWCLIRDYTINPRIESTAKIQSDRTKFLTAKLAALKSLTLEGNLDMKKLSSIKKSIRREIQNI